MTIEESARLRIIQITDVYTLVNFPSLKTLIKEKKAEQDVLGGRTISLLTGDFLAPYLLSSFDKGVGMMNVINKTPIDYLTWGNHEHDLDHASVMKREREYQGVWINSNMKTHESFKDSKCQVESAVVEITSKDGSNNRKLGMIGVLSSSPGLYKPGAFGGATIDDPWECLREYNAKLKNEQGCDMVLPLCHLYEFQDDRTCSEFDFPIVLSGHDHHRVDRVHEGSRLLKPGMDGHYAVVVDLIWESSSSASTPTIEVSTIPVADYAPDPELEIEVKKAYSVLDPLLKTDLATIPETYSPLSSRGVREHRATMATYLCTQVRHALNLETENYEDHCDCVMIRGGNIRGERDYSDFKFTLEGLNTEIGSGKSIHIFLVPGQVLLEGVKETWNNPNPGWMQYDDGVNVDNDGNIISISGAPLDKEKVYRVGSMSDFKTDPGNQPTFHGYFQSNPDSLPDWDAGIGCDVLLLKLFSNDVWKKLWKLLDTDGDGVVTREELKVLDLDGDGQLSKEELKSAMSKILGMSTCIGQDVLLDYVLVAGGDTDQDEKLTLDEINKIA